MRISELGEFGLIDLVQQWTKPAATAGLTGDEAFRLTVGNGDDAAAATFFRGPVTEFYTTDTMVDGIHFTTATTPWRDLGWKALASNISDIAAMGGVPTWALVTLGLPPDTLVADIAELYRGMTAICQEYQAQIIGGDMVSSPVVFVTVALTGVSEAAPMVRSGAKPGHQVAVTGPVGGSGGGLKLLLDGSDTIGQAATALVRQHRRPRPHVPEANVLVAAGVGVAMDVSDGLADDLGKLCSSSGVSARILLESVPVPAALREIFPDQWQRLALYGGEDYVLMFTAPPDVMALAVNGVPSAAIIGEITSGAPGQVNIIDTDGTTIARHGSGWDHFANPEASAH